ncbi:hypothetical protein [Nocardia sp. NPDC046763]|uniref:hypothetical protein n=1 Tax=Nocardia sp. NPDC046763 TaxID=3155256 RepID=UPI0033CB26F0
MPELPKTTKVGVDYLRRFAKSEHYVYRDPAKPGSGISKPALERLMRDRLVYLGKPVPGRGRPVVVTITGRSVLDAEEAHHA